jgi:hypothetical protein
VIRDHIRVKRLRKRLATEALTLSFHKLWGASLAAYKKQRIRVAARCDRGEKAEGSVSRHDLKI